MFYTLNFYVSMLFVPVVDFRVEGSAAGCRRVYLYRLFEQEPMMFYGILRLEQVGNIKRLQHCLSACRLNIERHIQVIL